MEKPDPRALIKEEDAKRCQIAEILLERGADANISEPKGHQTALHLASMNGFAETANILITKGNAKVVTTKIFNFDNSSTLAPKSISD